MSKRLSEIEARAAAAWKRASAINAIPWQDKDYRVFNGDIHNEKHGYVWQEMVLAKLEWKNRIVGKEDYSLNVIKRCKSYQELAMHIAISGVELEDVDFDLGIMIPRVIWHLNGGRW